MGPERGAIIAGGGGTLSQEIYRRFVQLAGGAGARIVVIPTAGTAYGGQDGWRAIEELRTADTETHRELEKLLERGGVIGGNSAGASALASFLIRGGEYNGEIVATERADGFGFLRNVALDQHLSERGREFEMFEVLRRAPHVLGIGLNEGAAIVVTGDLARVVGGRVAIYDITDPLTLIPMRWLSPGDVYDLGARRIVLSEEGLRGG